jgi:hypothetical protein
MIRSTPCLLAKDVRLIDDPPLGLEPPPGRSNAAAESLYQLG